MFPYLRLAALNLTLQKRRSILLGAAVATVTFLLLLLLSFVGGVTKNLTNAALTISSGHVNVGGFYKTRADRAQAAVIDAAKLTNIIQNNITDIDYVVARGRGWGRVISPTSSLNTSLLGVSSKDLPRMSALQFITQLKTTAPDGSELQDYSAFDSGTGAIVFQGQAERLGLKVGDSATFVTESNGGETGTVDLTVIGIASDLGFLSNFSIIVDNSVISNLYRFQPDTTGALHIYLKDIKRSGAVMEQMRKALITEGYSLLDHDPQPFFVKFRRIVSEDWKGQKLDLTVWEDEVSFLFWIITSLNGLSVFLIAVLGLIIAVGIANTTWMSVRERTREMGTLRAIGMEKHQVLLLYILEAILLGLASSIFGSLMGAFAVYGLNAAELPVGNSDLKAFLMSDTFRFSLTSVQFVISVAVISILTGLAAAFPAWKASKQQPVVALGHAS